MAAMRAAAAAEAATCGAALPPTLAALDEALAPALAPPSVLVLGYGVAHDLAQLRASFPEVPAFGRVDGVVDCAALVAALGGHRPRGGLSGLCEAVLGALRPYVCVCVCLCVHECL